MATWGARQSSDRSQRGRRKAPIAAFWSFLFPGLGQLYNHQHGLAAILATPMLLGLVAGGIALVLFQSTLLARLLDTQFILVLLGLNLMVLGWRLVAILDAHRFRARFGLRRVGTWVTTGLVVLAVGMHAVPSYYALKVMETLSAVSLDGRNDSSGEDGRGLSPLRWLTGEQLPRPSHEPEVERGERVNVLLVGVDSGVGRDYALTDTMLVVSIDTDGQPAMLSIPRDLVNAPMPNGEPYPNKLNSLLQTALANPAAYPLGGVGTLKGTIGNLLGVPIHYFAAVDMAGFREVIDSIGGVEVDVEEPIADAHSNFYLDAGPTFMNGELALTYVRSRHGAGNNDFVRAGRQQGLIAAVRNKLADANLLITLPRLLDAVQRTIASDVPQDRIPELAQAIQDADMTALERAVIQPPDYVTPATGAGGAYVLIPDLEAIRELAQSLMGDEG